MGNKRSMSPLAGDAVTVMDGKFSQTFPAHFLKALSQTGVTGSGIVLCNVSQRFSLIHQDAKGDFPVNYGISIRITRDPLLGNDVEIEAVAKAAAESKATQDKRKLDDTKERQASIKAAQDMTRDLIRDGMALNPVQSPVALLKQIGEVAPVLKALKDSL